MIELKNVSFSYGKDAILQDFSHIFPTRGTVALMGESGKGKTTLLRLLCGLEKPLSGQVINGFTKTAYAFQEPRLIPWLSCKENINFVLSDHEKEQNIAASVLEKVELSHCEDMLPTALSGGMKQRLSLARAMATGADLLLLDEPFTGLDQELKVRIAARIKAANPTGLTVLVTHDPADAALLGARTLTFTPSGLVPYPPQ
ncbi:MAG: ABC transporter ATP-binding protein [Ruminococcaceae bacterium]|nr:ABC transporter ATP-binding protein [Oscillospiraceae bacterium]